MDKCEDHDNCMKDIRIDQHKGDLQIAELKGVVDGFVKVATKYIDSSQRDLYNKDGLIDRVGNHNSQLKYQWGAITLLIAAIILRFFTR